MKKHSKKVIREEVFRHHPKMEPWKKLLLIFPAFISTAWVVYLQYNRQVYSEELLAPLNTNALMLALILFTMGYIIFIALMFSDNIKEFFTNLTK